MKRFVRTAVIVLMIISLLGVSSCSMIKEKLFPGQEETYTLPEEETGPVTIPEKGCSIEYPKRRPYEYEMDLTLDTEANTVGGHVVIKFYNDSSDTWKELCLRDYPSLFDKADVYAKQSKSGGGITEIINMKDSRTGDLKVRREDGDASAVWLNLDEELNPGKFMTLSYDFKTMIPNNADRFGFSNDIYNVTNFYPILAEYVDGEWSHAGYITVGECFYSEISDYKVRLTVPDDYKVASTGERVLSSPKDGKLTYRFEAAYVRDFVFCASKSFANEQRNCDGVIVNLFYNKENPPEKDMSPVSDVAFTTAENSLKAFGEAFGKYPYKELDIVITPNAAGGMEYPNLVIIADYVCHRDIKMYEDFDQLDIVLCHEIAHQWFMGIVGSNSGVEPWLDESLASYAEIVYYEYLGGEKEKNHIYGLSKNERSITKNWKDKDKLDAAYSEFVNDISYTRLIYSEGKAVLYQMEEILGREKFHGIIRGYVRRNAFKNANTKDFLKALYDCAGKDNEELNKLVEKVFRTKI